jgi:hypothetical protein
MKRGALFVVSAGVEIGAGSALVLLPALTVSILIGAPFDTRADSVAGRVAGAALLALGVACWGARLDEYNSAATSIVSAMLLYNIGVAGVLAYAGIGLRLFGIGLWPAVVLHVVMAAWCLGSLLLNE